MARWWVPTTLPICWGLCWARLWVSPQVGALWLSAFRVAFWVRVVPCGDLSLGQCEEVGSARNAGVPTQKRMGAREGSVGCRFPAVGPLVPHQSVSMRPDPGPLSLGFAFVVLCFLLCLPALPSMFTGCVALGRASSRPLLPASQPGELCVVGSPSPAPEKAMLFVRLGVLPWIDALTPPTCTPHHTPGFQAPSSAVSWALPCLCQPSSPLC